MTRLPNCYDVARLVFSFNRWSVLAIWRNWFSCRWECPSTLNQFSLGGLFNGYSNAAI